VLRLLDFRSAEALDCEGIAHLVDAHERTEAPYNEKSRILEDTTAPCSSPTKARSSTSTTTSCCSGSAVNR
jgi:hypothetical protein